eukprot:765814-Hanusia_phi.AAC.1
MLGLVCRSKKIFIEDISKNAEFQTAQEQRKSANSEIHQAIKKLREERIQRIDQQIEMHNSDVLELEKSYRADASLKAKEKEFNNAIDEQLKTLAANRNYKVVLDGNATTALIPQGQSITETLNDVCKGPNNAIIILSPKRNSDPLRRYIRLARNIHNAVHAQQVLRERIKKLEKPDTEMTDSTVTAAGDKKKPVTPKTPEEKAKEIADCKLHDCRLYVEIVRLNDLQQAAKQEWENENAGKEIEYEPSVRHANNMIDELQIAHQSASTNMDRQVFYLTKKTAHIRIRGIPKTGRAGNNGKPGRKGKGKRGKGKGKPYPYPQFHPGYYMPPPMPTPMPWPYHPGLVPPQHPPAPAAKA